MRCPKCNNIMRKVPIKDHVWMGMNKGYCYAKVGEEWVCDYCVWKGNSSMGARLRQAIKTINERKNAT